MYSLHNKHKMKTMREKYTAEEKKKLLIHPTYAAKHQIHQVFGRTHKQNSVLMKIKSFSARCGNMQMEGRATNTQRKKNCCVCMRFDSVQSPVNMH